MPSGRSFWVVGFRISVPGWACRPTAEGCPGAPRELGRWPDWTLGALGGMHMAVGPWETGTRELLWGVRSQRRATVTVPRPFQGWWHPLLGQDLCSRVRGHLKCSRGPILSFH